MPDMNINSLLWRVENTTINKNSLPDIHREGYLKI